VSLAINELVTSRTLGDTPRSGVWERTLKRVYMITGSDDSTNGAVLALGPQRAAPYDINPALALFVYDRQHEVVTVGKTSADGAIRLTVTYGPASRLASDSNGDGGAEDSDPEYEVNVGSQTIHLESAPYGQEHYPPYMPDDGVGDMIGVDGDRVSGVDVYVPKANYCEVRRVDTLDRGYVKRVGVLAAHVNYGAWKLWEQEEVLFLGMTASRKGHGLWTLRYNFNIEYNVTLEPEGMPPIVKPGQRYLWLTKKVTANATSTQHAIERYHVASMYPYANFAELGLGV
jgi:hypothetical protein